MRTILFILNCAGRHAILATVLIIVISSSSFGQNQAPEAVEKTFTLVIDAGHGGKAPGAVGKFSKEKDIALAIAKKTGTYISSLMSDVKVIYTRTTDVNVDLNRRANIAIENNADLFLSIHVNGNDKSSVYGAETYVMGPSKNEKNLELAKKENSVILIEDDHEANYEGFNPNDPASYIMFSVSQYAYLNQSLKMASEVQDQLRIRADRKDGGVRQGPFLVLWKTTMPSVLVETGYITNTEEEKYLNTDYGQDVIASSIYTAFMKYKEKTEENTTTLAAEAEKAKEEAAEKTKTQVDQKSDKPVKIEPVQKQTKTIEKAEITETAKEKVTQKVSSDGLVFRVQVLASQNKIPKGSRHFKGVSKLEEIQMDGFFKYMSAPLATYSQSQELKKELAPKFPGTFIVAFLNGKKIPLPEAIRLDKEK